MSNKERSSPRETPIFPQKRRTPSFSSSLLDSIYRSIDESNGGDQEQVVCREEETLFKKQSHHSVSKVRLGAFVEEEEQHKLETSTLRHAVMIETWMEKQSTRRSSRHYNSASSSSDSSNGGGGCIFSSSSEEAESLKEISPRTKQKEQKPKIQDGFTKTKLRALKIYEELKKVKQPISPGGRIASFLNSIFSPGSAKKVKMCSIGKMDDVSYERKSKSASSSVSSFSRSCLTKTPPPPPPSSRVKSSSNSSTKRSVRFYPVSVIVDEDSKPCGHKSIYEDDPGLMPINPQKAMKKSSNSSSIKKKAEVVSQAAEYVRRYQKKDVNEFDFRGFHRYVEEEEDEDESDDESCASSDLFELDHLMGIGRYSEELPVYETTNLKTNQAIANGFFV